MVLPLDETLALERRRIDVTPFLESACELFDAQAAPKQFRLNCRAERVFAVYADHGRVLQLLNNLLTNAIRLTAPGGHFEVRAQVAGDVLGIPVSDTGPGLSPTDVPLLFERFWQGKREVRGSFGLDLAIAKGIVQRMAAASGWIARSRHAPAWHKRPVPCRFEGRNIRFS